ncbi:hypothetical protein KGM_203566 [Danaus plexippus plexippus]|uniref:Uncharacterized protein n=1 Tax=Danaus plexippus plexippus TaxID=278856 RepID=A0A212EWP9_DANPL|nr:hypothetical protein KGM_203566 [Danaus plexippus plexippus]
MTEDYYYTKTVGALDLRPAPRALARFPSLDTYSTPIPVIPRLEAPARRFEAGEVGSLLPRRQACVPSRERRVDRGMYIDGETVRRRDPRVTGG